jgi:curved DNA-binding protein CbpA
MSDSDADDIKCKIIKSLKILNIDDYNLNTISLTDIKHKYKFLSLKYHPDKNINNDTTSKFQEISEAYHFIELYINEREKYNNIDNYINEENNNINKNIDSLFNYLFNNFENIINNIKTFKQPYNSSISSINIFDTILNNKDNMENLFSLIKYILENSELLKIIKSEYSYNILEILKLYKEELGVSNEKFDYITGIINETIKVSEKPIKKINLIPSINNLINCDLYKLIYEEKLYYIPLWHNELTYEFDDHNLLIEITPNLDENNTLNKIITIDKNNNICIDIIESIINLFQNKILTINIGGKILILDSEKLNIKEHQTYVFKKKGIPIINCNDIYNTNKKSDVILNIKLVF